MATKTANSTAPKAAAKTATTAPAKTPRKAAAAPAADVATAAAVPAAVAPTAPAKKAARKSPTKAASAPVAAPAVEAAPVAAAAAPVAPAPAWHGAPDAQLARVWSALQQQCGASADWPAFDARVRAHLGTLRQELAPLYGWRDDFETFLVALLTQSFQGWAERAPALKALDTEREADPEWFQSHRMIGGVCYVDLFAGDLQGVEAQIPYFKELGLTYLHLMPPYLCPEPHSDGGYAVSSYRAVKPSLGHIDDLRRLAGKLREQGISLVLDFVFNHTSDEHDWARAALAHDPKFSDYFYIYPDRQQPDAYERTVREIFPDEHPGAFSQLADGRWVWTTFHSYQWDLNYSNPEVFTAMAGEMLFIANLGVEFLRMDAVAFIWKRLGTSCENLPEAHHLLRAYNAVARIAAPALLFKSEAIVHPDDVVKYIEPAECQIAYNPLQMALLWNTMATREVNMLQQALAQRHHIPDGTAWVNYVRSHDDIGWTFADEDAIQFGIQGFNHRTFLNRFFVNRFEGSFARGVPFQDNPATGDCRISGTAASLVGLEQGDAHAVARILLMSGVALSTGGIPLIYLGDEVGALNDPDWDKDPAQASDSRWVHRPRRDLARAAQRHDPSTDAGRIFHGLRRLIDLRQHLPVFAGGRLAAFWSKNPSVLGYQRQQWTDGRLQSEVLVLGNFSEQPQTVAAEVLSGMPAQAVDLISNIAFDLRDDLTLGAYQMVWLQCPR